MKSVSFLCSIFSVPEPFPQFHLMKVCVVVLTCYVNLFSKSPEFLCFSTFSLLTMSGLNACRHSPEMPCCNTVYNPGHRNAPLYIFQVRFFLLLGNRVSQLLCCICGATWATALFLSQFHDVRGREE